MKKLVTSYTFDASAKTIVSADFTALEKVLVITNVTDNIIIYNFADAAKGGSLASTTLTLDYDTTAMDDTDKLQIFVDDAATSMPVNDNSGSLTVDGTVAISGTTAISAASLPLPSGAATAVKQPSLGTAGTASSDVITVQGVASMTPVKVDGSATTQPVSGSVTADTEMPAAAALTDSDSQGPTVPTVGSYVMVHNANAGTAQRMKTVFSGQNTSGAGILAAGMTAQFDDTSPTSITENNYGNVRMSANRNLYGTIRDAAGNERGANVDASNNLQVNLNNVGQALTYRPDNADGVATVSTNSALEVVGRNTVYNGTTWDRARGSTTGTQMIGGLAHDAADTTANQPTKVGGQARTTNPTAVSDADVSNLVTDKLGKLIAVGSIRDLKGDQTTTITSSTTETTIVTAAGASVFADVYFLTITNTSATATEVTIRDVTAGGTAQSFMVPAGDTRGFALPEGAARKQGTANSAWTATCGTSVASVKVYAAYVKNT